MLAFIGTIIITCCTRPAGLPDLSCGPIFICCSGYLSFHLRPGGWERTTSRPLPQGVTPKSQLTWYDRKGNPLETLGPPADYDEPVISRDGKLLAFTQGTRSSRNIWIRDLTRRT